MNDYYIEYLEKIQKIDNVKDLIILKKEIEEEKEKYFNLGDNLSCNFGDTECINLYKDYFSRYEVADYFIPLVQSQIEYYFKNTLIFTSNK